MSSILKGVASIGRNPCKRSSERYLYHKKLHLHITLYNYCTAPYNCCTCTWYAYPNEGGLAEIGKKWLDICECLRYCTKILIKWIFFC